MFEVEKGEIATRLFEDMADSRSGKLDDEMTKLGLWRPGHLLEAGTSHRSSSRLTSKDAVGNALRTIFLCAEACHINDGKLRVDLPGLPCNFPTVHPATQVDVGVTSARYFVKPPFSKLTASSPDAAIAGSKPPSARAASTMV